MTDQNDLIFFSESSLNLDEDFSTWHRWIMKHLDNHAPVNTKRIQHKRFPEWYTPKIAHIQRLRDNCKRQKQWSDFKRSRNNARHIIRSAKRKYFADSIISSKEPKFIWRHLRSVNNNTKTSSDSLPHELVINGETVTKSKNIAAHLNEYFSSIAEILNEPSDQTPELDTDRLRLFANSKIPDHISFHILLITRDQVLSFINKLDPAKATGIDGLGPRIIKMSAHVLAPSITLRINKSLESGKFPTPLKLAKVFPIFKGRTKTEPSSYRPI